MTLRRKTMIVVGVVLVALIFIQYIASKTILQKSFSDLEIKYTQKNVKQAMEAVSSEINYFEKKILDYSMWDDTYKFIEDKNKNYVESNLVDTTFEGLNINFIGFINSKGEIVYCKGFDQNKEEMLPLSMNIQEDILQNKFFLSKPDSNKLSGIKGIVMLPQGPVMVVSKPVLNSKGKGPAKGTIIVGRFLDSTEMNYISGVTRLSVNINKFDEISSYDYSYARTHFLKSSDILIKSFDKNKVAGYAELKDVFGKPVLILRVDMPREIYTQGQQSITFFTVSLILSGIVIIIIILLLLEKLVLARVSFLSSSVSNIGSERDISVRIISKGKDEISNLAKEVNLMLGELEKSQSVLRESEYRYRHLFESMLDGFAYYIVLQDEVGRLEDYVFIDVNDAFKKIIGIGSEEVKGKRVTEINRDIKNSMSGLMDVYGSAAIKGEKINFVYFSEVSSRWYMVSAFSPAHGYFITIFHDITERKHNEEELRRAKETAEYANQAKSQFLATMSHEIRTPMNAIIGMSELLLDTSLDNKQKDLISTVHSSGSLLLNIINDVLDFSKIEANKLILNNMEFDLTNVVEDVAEFMAVKAREKNISLMTFISPEIPLIRGDSERLKQVLLNLVGNAIKFTEQGEVIVRAVLEHEDEKCVSVLFEVKDTGIGISEDVQKRLFQPFMQADGSTTRKYGGTGLGLSISKRLINMMNGEIGIISSDGEGASFIFNVGFERINSKPQPSLDKIDLGVLRLLVVNHGKTGTDIIQSYISSWGMENGNASNLEEAVDILISDAEMNNPYDLLIVNLTTEPVESVFDFASRIKLNPLISKTKLFLITVTDARDLGTKAIESGFSAYLTKPVKQSQLLDCIANVINKNEENIKIDNTISLQSENKVNLDFDTDQSKVDKILLVEDNPINQKLARMQLEKLGISISIANNGQEAVEAVKNNLFKLIFMDCQMPVMDGFEATSTIRKLEAVMGRRTIIVAMTANAMQGDQEKCIASGMDDYISKPVNIQKLKEIMKKWEIKTESTA